MQISKSLVIAALAASSLVSVRAADKTYTPEELAAIKAKVMKNHGGIITRAGEGVIGLYDCQSRVEAKFLEGRAAVLRENLNGFNVKAEKMDAPKPGTLPAKPANVKAALFVVDDPALPMSLVAPEAQWGLVNVAVLAADKPDATKLNARVAKELSRVAASAFGGSLCAMGSLVTVSTVAELDKADGDQIPFMLLNNVMHNLQNLGMTVPRKSSYKKACREGWAPAPTNDAQKAIWDAAHDEKERGPVNGLKILPPKK